MTNSYLSATALLLGLSLPNCHQAAAQGRPATERVYTYVDQMPHLREGGGTAGIFAALQQRLQYSEEARRIQAQGKVLIRFIVDKDGWVRRVWLAQGLQPDCDAAAVWAARQLSRLEPGRRAGKPVAVSLTLPVYFPVPATGP